MKITHNKVGQNLNVNDTKESNRADKSGAAEKSGGSSGLASLTSDPDAVKVNLSSAAQDMKKIKELAMAAPDVDEAKVARLQKLIDDGKYKVDAKEVADRMVDEHVAW